MWGLLFFAGWVEIIERLLRKVFYWSKINIDARILGNDGVYFFLGDRVTLFKSFANGPPCVWYHSPS